jgi:hypothetical protein
VIKKFQQRLLLTLGTIVFWMDPAPASDLYDSDDSSEERTIFNRAYNNPWLHHPQRKVIIRVSYQDRLGNTASGTALFQGKAGTWGDLRRPRTGPLHIPFYSPINESSSESTDLENIPWDV